MNTFTFNIPHILKSISRDENGFFHREVREGGDRQIEYVTETEEVAEPVEEKIFRIRATNQLNFAGAVINVLNDEVVIPPDFRLVPTSPTASEYLALVGKRVLVGFDCRELPPKPDAKPDEKPVYRVDRTFITLP